MQKGVIDGFDHLHDKECVLADQVIIFQINDDILFSGVPDQFTQALRCARNVWLPILRGLNMHANAGRANLHGDIHELFSVCDGFGASSSVRVVEAVLAIHCNVDDFNLCFRQGSAEVGEIIRLQGMKVATVGLDIVNIEFSDHFGGKIFQVHSGEFGIAIVIGRALDVRAKRIRRNRDAVVRCGRKSDVRLGGGCGESKFRTAREECGCGRSTNSFEK